MKTSARSFFQLSFPAVLLAALIGCSNTEITQEYVDPQYKDIKVGSIMVIGVAQKQAARIEFEDAFTKALKQRGVNAVASHTLVPELDSDSTKVIAAANAAGLKTILITRYMGEMSQEVYHPGTIYYGVAPAYGGSYYGGFGGYYGHAYEVAYQQPVYTSNVTHTLVSDLYVTESKEHIWQAVSDTIQAGSTKKLRDDAIHGLIGNLHTQGLLD